MLEVTEIEVEGYERVVRGVDSETGLHAIVAVHDTTLGPALGGMRMWPYATEEEALTDALRLARGMTYKSALARTGLGGGKAVIIGDPKKDKSPGLFRSMGELINCLGGKYITAEDVSITDDDLEVVAETCRWVSGRVPEKGGSGNPSPYTAHGTLAGLRACLEHAFGSDSFEGKHFALQGLGAVAKPLAQMIHDSGGMLTICDVNEDHINWAKENLERAVIVEPHEIFEVECDVFVPCALGAVVNDDTILQLKARIVAGCANNQLQDDRHAHALRDREILYAPDYVINAGGIINVSCEFEDGGYDENASMSRVTNIYDTLKEIFSTAEGEGITTLEAADRVAEKRLKNGRSS